MMVRFIKIFKKLFSADAPKKIARRIKIFGIARSVVRVNPLFRAFSRQLRLRPVRLGVAHTVVVVGADGGIGEAVVRQLLKQGCTVIGTYRTRSPSSLAGEGLRLLRMDITSVHDVCEVYSYLRQAGVQADIILVAAGFSSKLDYHAALGDGPLDEDALKQESKDILGSFEVNALGPYLAIRRFAALIPATSHPRHFVPQICLLSSSIGTMHNELYGGMYAYRTGKGALHALAMAMYCDLNLIGRVGLLILGPGNVATKMNPGGKMSPEEAAREIIRNIEYSARKARFQFLGVGGKRIPW